MGYVKAEFIELLIFPVQYTCNAGLECTSNVSSHITEAIATYQAQIRGILMCKIDVKWANIISVSPYFIQTVSHQSPDPQHA